MSGTSTLLEPKQLYNKGEWRFTENLYRVRDIPEKEIITEHDSVVLNPKLMELDKFYLSVIDNKPYLYRKIDDNEIEVYGFAG